MNTEAVPLLFLFVQPESARRIASGVEVVVPAGGTSHSIESIPIPLSLAVPVIVVVPVISSSFEGLVIVGTSGPVLST